MSKDSRRNSSKERATREIRARKSYDTIPQPKGEFRDLFLQMQERKAENKEDSTRTNKPSK